MFSGATVTTAFSVVDVVVVVVVLAVVVSSDADSVVVDVLAKVEADATGTVLRVVLYFSLSCSKTC